MAPTGREATRVGIVAGKKIGTAVVRNRVKRLLREAARARLSCLPPGYDIVLIARPEAAGAGLGDISAALEVLLQRERLLAREKRSDGP
jgi:ribonuclease P protein component